MRKAKKDLFAMIRQLGPASLFCSFSSAETQWIHLLKILDQLVDHKEYSINELENMNWDEKCRLIQSDPVTCARHFDYQITLVKQIWNIPGISRIFLEISQKKILGISRIYCSCFLEISRTF